VGRADEGGKDMPSGDPGRAACAEAGIAGAHGAAGAYSAGLLVSGR
jgi:hypothetical protein